ncbi:DUF4292 domain-containing protein [Flavobacterium sp.]|jgi:hypothetical protein|uniref:DUF4292 domain-containing protein n=1 Tax=Flavobacterium sp. TaxID=239 RepID=UPI0037C18019
MKKYLALLLLFTIVSCKTKAVLAKGTASNSMSSDKIIENHYKNKTDFSTLYIKADVNYKDEKQSQNVTAEIKIKKDEMILVSVRFLGITIAKGLITPQGVKYYEKMNGKFFEGNYKTLSDWLGTDLDFQKVQNMLIGQALDNLKKNKYKSSLEEGLYKLENSDATIEKKYFFEASKFLVKKQQINQPVQNRMLKILYDDYKEYPEANMPIGLLVEATQGKEKTNIKVDYKAFTFNEELSFPYSVPSNYEQIFIH